jgi:hypothetical protein
MPPLVWLMVNVCGFSGTVRVGGKPPIHLTVPSARCERTNPADAEFEPDAFYLVSHR